MKRGAEPMPRPWPNDDRLDPELLENGDYRNVSDGYRYWTVEAIADDMRGSSSGLEIAVENLERDFNLGTIIRNANAFNVSKVHIIGSRQWNKRGAMKTDAYLDIQYHKTIDEFISTAGSKSLVAIDNVPGSKTLDTVDLPRESILIFGGEGPGISPELLEKSNMIVSIPQFGSTRSINVGVASGILMYKWVERHILLK